MTNSANDRQVGGSHYAGEYQHWDMVRDAGLGYFEAQVTKYVGRSRKKNGKQDVEKSSHFLEKMIENRDTGRVNSHSKNLLSTPGIFARYADANNLNADEREVTRLIMFWNTADDLREAKSIVDRMIAPVVLGSEQVKAVDETAGLSDSEGGTL